MQIDKNEGLWFVFFRMRIAKTTFSRKRPIWCSMYSTNLKFYCPVEILLLWWEFTGWKKEGFLFANGDSHDNGDSAYYQMQRIARKHKFEVTPTKHTPRNTLVATMFQLGFSLDAIRRKFNWVMSSEMPHHYLAYKLDKMPTEIAHTLARSLKSRDLDFQDRLLNVAA